MELISADEGAGALLKLLKDGCPEGQEAIVVGHGISVDDLREMRKLMLETIKDGNRLYLALPKEAEIIVQYYEE